MKKIVYCKYNQSRAEQYRIKTVIYEQNGKRYVEKIPLSAKALPHTQRFLQNFERLKGQYVNVSYLPAERAGQGLRYPFVEGETLDLYFRPYLYQGDELFGQLNALVHKIYQTVPGCTCAFARSEAFAEWFGDADCTGERCIKPANLDLTFSNIIQAADGGFLAFDYEWTVSVPVPQDFIVFRALHHFYIQYASLLMKTYTLEEFMQRCGIAPEKCRKYEQMESNMYKKICTGAEAAFGDSFQVGRTSFETVLYEKQLLRETTDLLHHTEQEYLSAIGGWERKEEAYEQQAEKLTAANQACAKQIEALTAQAEALTAHQKACEQQVQDLLAKNKDCGQRIQDLSAQNQALDGQLGMVYQSFSWRITRPLRLAKRAVQCAGENGTGYTLRYAARRIQRKLLKHPQELGAAPPQDQVVPYSGTQAQDGSACAAPHAGGFVQEAHIVSGGELQRQRKARFSNEPKISIITPLFRTPKDYLEQMIASVIGQTYGNWELCLYDCSGPGHETIEEICRGYMERERRILYTRGENYGISENTNRCIELSAGDYIGLLDHDDCLHPSALYEVVKAVNETQCDFIYSDEIKFDGDISHSFAPNFKPDFAADELRVHNFICHFNVYSRSLYKKAGGYRREFDGSQDHDLVLRLTERAERIVHIPKILYYWRVHKNSVAMNINAKSYATEAGIRAVDGQLARMGQEKQVRSIRDNIPCYRMSFCKRSQERLTLVVWDAKDTRQARGCIQSVLDSEACLDRIVVIPSVHVQAGQPGPHAMAYDCIWMQRKGRTEAGLWNEVMEQYVDQYAIFIHASLRVCTKDIGQEMLLYLTQEGTACVDARLLSGRTLLSGGVVLGSGADGTVRRWKCRNCGLPAANDGYEDYLIHARNVLTVSGFCTGFSKAVWKTLHGFSQQDAFWLAYGTDADQNGYRNVWTPYVTADGDLLEQIREMQDKNLPPAGFPDPYYNRNIEKYGLDA